MPKSVKPLNKPWVIKTEAEKERWQQEPFYNSRAWRKDSKAHLASNPLCEECQRKGRVTLSEISDHIKPWKKGGELWDWENRQALCKSCHYSKSAKDK